jgi:lipid A 4'-phosphatase
MKAFWFIQRTQRPWLVEASVLLAIGALITLAFALAPIDDAVAGFFFRTVDGDHWPLVRHWPWSWLYRLAPVVTISLLGAGLFALLQGRVKRDEFWRISGTFLVLSVLLGPGLIINPLFKDHWDRPRPRDVVEFGGALQYTPAPLLGDGGDSFPCDQCSAGFLYAGGWWLWRRRRPARARLFLALGLAIGLALGLGRMAAGEHFLSDVLWSALLALGLEHVLYYYILRIPQQSTSPGASLPGKGTMVLLLILAVIARFPHGERFTTHIRLASLLQPPQLLEITSRAANIDIVIGDLPNSQIVLTGELHGFGLPANRLEASTAFRAEPVATLSCRIEQEGWVNDLNASATIRVPAGTLTRIDVRLEQGNIRVIDTTAGQVVRSGKLRLDLQTRAGNVQQPQTAVAF